MLANLGSESYTSHCLVNFSHRSVQVTFIFVRTEDEGLESSDVAGIMLESIKLGRVCVLFNIGLLPQEFIRAVVCHFGRNFYNGAR